MSEVAQGQGVQQEGTEPKKEWRVASGEPVQRRPSVGGKRRLWQNQQSRSRRKAPAPDLVTGRPLQTLVRVAGATEAWPQGAEEWGSKARTRECFKDGERVGTFLSWGSRIKGDNSGGLSFPA